MDGSASATVVAAGSRRSDTPQPGAVPASGVDKGRRIARSGKAATGIVECASDAAGRSAGTGEKNTRLRSRGATVPATSPGGSKQAAALSRTVPADERPVPAAPVGDMRNEPGGEPSGASAAMATPEAAGTPVPPPWLTAAQYADTLSRHRRLKDIKDKLPHKPERQDLSKALSLLERMEGDMKWVGRTLAESRTRLLSDIERRQLYWLQDQAQLELPQHQRLLINTLGRLSRYRALGQEELRLVDDLQSRFDDACDYLLTCRPPWSSEIRRIETTLPLGTGKRVALDSHVIRGNALRGLVAEGSAAEPGMGEFGGARYFFAPGLELTGLCNASGTMLYAGLRHGVFHAHELNGELLARQADDDALRSVFRDYRRSLSLRSPAELDRADELVSAEAEDDFLLVRTSSSELLERQAESLRAEAGRSALLDTISAALVFFPETFSEAVAGKKVFVPLFSIALLTPADVAAWRTQHDLFHNASPIRMQPATPDPQATPETIETRYKVRQFALPATRERLCLDGSDGVGRGVVERLLGPLHSPVIGGDAGRRLLALNVRATKLREDIVHVHRQDIPIAMQPDCGVYVHPATVERTLSRLGHELAHTQKSIRTLTQCGEYLKAMWQVEGDWPAGGNVIREVAAPLLLLGYLMREVPLVSCVSGRDYTRQLEKEVRLLAAVADNSDSHVGPSLVAGSGWEQARKDLQLGDGPDSPTLLPT